MSENLTVKQSVAGGGTVSFSSPEDRVLTGFTAAVQCILTTDPAATYVNEVSTPAVTETDRGTLLISTGNAFLTNLKIPINAGKTYFVNFKSAGAICFYFDLPSISAE